MTWVQDAKDGNLGFGIIYELPSAVKKKKKESI